MAFKPSYDADAVVKMALNRAMTLELSVEKTTELILSFLRAQDWLRSEMERDWFKDPSLTTKFVRDAPTDQERPIDGN